MPKKVKLKIVVKPISIPEIEYVDLKLAATLAGQTFSAFAVSAMQDRARQVKDKYKKIQEGIKK